MAYNKWFLLSCVAMCWGISASELSDEQKKKVLAAFNARFDKEVMRAQDVEYDELDNFRKERWKDTMSKARASSQKNKKKQ